MGYKDIKVDNLTYEISLVKMTGKKIKDIHGYLGDPFDCGDIYFEATNIIFKDGSKMDLKGEPDVVLVRPYSKWPQKNFDDESLEMLYEQQENDK